MSLETQKKHELVQKALSEIPSDLLDKKADVEPKINEDSERNR